METIHTDSAYKIPSRKTSEKVKIKMHSEESVNHNEQRSLQNSIVPDQNGDTKTEVIISYSLLELFIYLLMYNTNQ